MSCVDSCEPHVGSSQPETSTSGNGAVTEAGSSHAVVETSGETELSGNSKFFHRKETI